ncbi:BrnT family toxin [Plesiomonas shigelloides]|uniref:BrnT family toxin n=1 Tax=Plesiomonas shigelloides TaxID=703 RepID=UPI001E55563D|nr:BrnT family toxin [Plesiomonas shigelloides]
MEKDIKLLNEMKELLYPLSEEELLIRLDSLELEEKRKQILCDILSGRVDIGLNHKLDVFSYAIKNLFQDKFESLGTVKHLYSNCDLYEYDPPKNGQNLIKHGISFSEVVSYSRNFGSLMVPCPHTEDSERVVIFSDLANLTDMFKLELPLNSNMQSDCYIISIVKMIGIRCKFISSRVMSKTRYKKTLKNALKNIYTDDPEKKEMFVDRCIEILKKNLFEIHA